MVEEPYRQQLSAKHRGRSFGQKTGLRMTDVGIRPGQVPRLTPSRPAENAGLRRSASLPEFHSGLVSAVPRKAWHCCRSRREFEILKHCLVRWSGDSANVHFGCDEPVAVPGIWNVVLSAVFKRNVLKSKTHLSEPRRTVTWLTRLTPPTDFHVLNRIVIGSPPRAFPTLRPSGKCEAGEK